MFLFPQVYKLEASAGSGKTYALAKRYTQLLINPYLKLEEVPLNTILAITFTNKAAIEMKERILEFLKKIALDKFADPKEKDDILSSLCVKEEFARKKAYKIMDGLIRNYNFFQVQTIDSFVNTILSGCAFKLDLSASFKTKEDYSQYLAYSLDKLIDAAGHSEDILKLFHNFLKHYLYIENKTGWFPKQDIFSIITSLFSKSNKYHGKFIRSNIEAKDLILCKKNILELINELRQNLPAATHASFSKILSAFLEQKQNKDSFDVDELSDFFKREDFPLNKGNPLPRQTGKLWNKIRKNISRLCELESVSALDCYVDIFDKVIDELKNISTRDDVLFLEALNKEARSLFDERSLGLPELYWRLACRFRHFLIDEFQDTSRLQWENLFIMIEEALSTGGSLFYVGDKKQAIYRFRGGEVSLIDSEKERFRDFNLIEESLTTNYRSRREIVEFNNRVFSEENLRRFLNQKEETKKGTIEFGPSDMDEIVEVFQGSRQGHKGQKAGGYVKLEFVDYKTKEERNEALRDKVLSLIKDLSTRFSLEDIALLARKNDEVELLTSWLLERGIPVESEKTLNIKQNSFIKELISFLKFLNSPIDNLSFASFILGDIFLKASGMDSQKIQDFIFEFQNKNNKESTYLYREFRLQFPKAWDALIEEFFKGVGFIPLYELVISILSKFNVLRDFSGYQGFFMRFLELIREQEEERASIGSFLEFFDKAADDDLYVNVTESESIKILTIHKSKGLEFGVVIIPFLEMNVKVDSQVIVTADRNLRLMHIKRRYADFSEHLKEVYRGEYLNSFIDELNSIYVAFTRASEELYVFVSVRAETGFNLASLLLPRDNLEMGERMEYRKDNNKKAPTIEIPFSEYKDWIHLLKDEFIDEGILQDREKILKGEVLHYILSFIGNLHNQNKDLILNEAVDKARVRFPFIHDLNVLKLTVNRLLENNALRPYFEVADGRVYLEKEIVDSSGDTKRIDRLILKPEEAWIVDYKSTKEKQSTYYAQLLEYIKIVQDIYPNLSVKGILIYLDELSTEEFNAQSNSL